MWDTFLGMSGADLGRTGLAIGLFVVVSVLGQRVLRLVLHLGRRWVRRTGTTLDDLVFDVVDVPLYWLLVAVTFDITRTLLPPFSPGVQAVLAEVTFILYFLVAFLFVWRLVDKGSRWYGHQIAVRTATNLDEQLIPFFRRISLILTAMVALVMLLDHFGINPMAVLTTLGIGSLAIALAAQTTFSDAINGFIIMVDRPFRIGDRIEIRELNTWGDVVDIGLRSTRIRTLDNRMVIVPNSVIGQSLVVNHSYPDLDYRMHALVGIAYGSDVDLARKVIHEAVQRSPGVLTERPIHVLFVEMGDSALIFRLQWWVRIWSELDIYQMYDSVLTSVYKALNEAGITIPFPQRDVHHKVDPEDREVLARLLGRSAAGR